MTLKKNLVQLEEGGNVCSSNKADKTGSSSLLKLMDGSYNDREMDKTSGNGNIKITKFRCQISKKEFL